jgi:acetyltransferase
MTTNSLERMFQPRTIAVVGASDRKGSVGAALMHNLKTGRYAGRVFPVNRHHREVAGRPAFPSISDIGERIDLVIVTVPIAQVPEIIADCARKNAGGAVIISAGGKETGPSGREIEAAISVAAGPNLRVIGPNCLGIISTGADLNASFAAEMPLRGKMAFISQSGAVCGAVLDLSLREQIGFRYFISLGSMLDVDFGDMIDYLGGDPRVSSIVMYVESLTRIRNFMSAARAVSRIKPIVVLKAGRTQAGAKAAASHTGALAGEDAVYDAAFKRAGILRVKTFEELFDCAELLAKQPKPTGTGLVMVTNAGGPGVMAADALSDCGFDPTPLSEETLAKLDAVLPPHWSRSNPIDMLGDSSVDQYRKVVNICGTAPETDGLLIMLVPQAMIDPAGVARALIEPLKDRPFPVFTAWIGGPRVEKGREIFNRAAIPTFDTPERAIRAFMDLWRYTRNIEMLQEIPARFPHRLAFDTEKARKTITSGHHQKSDMLTEVESKTLLAAYGIPVNPTEVAFSAEEAAKKAEKIGFPLALKIYSRTVSHKSDVGGVLLGVRNAAEVVEAFAQIIQNVRARQPDPAGIEGVTLQPMLPAPVYELILGVKKDRDFGPVILFGTGGIMTEVYEDRALALPPLTRLLARRLMEETRVFRLLKGYRNRPAADLEKLEEILIRLAQLATDFAEIEELDINPLFVTADGYCAVDARVRIGQTQTTAQRHLVVSAYPGQYETTVVTTGLVKIFIRPIRPEDAPLMAALFDSLSSRSIYHRFFSPLKHLPHSMLARFTQVDYDREIALVAFKDDTEQEQMLGVARVILKRDKKTAEFSVLVGDPWQGKGIGAELLKKCLIIAAERGIERISGLVLTENTQMLALGKKLGFQIHRVPQSDTFELGIELRELGRM